MQATAPLKPRSALATGVVVFLISGFIAMAAVWGLDQSSIKAAKLNAAIEVAEQANAMQVSIDRALSATYALGAMVKQGGGKITDFNSVADKLLPYYPGVQSLQLAPGGIVRQIYPLAGNERAIGHDLLADPQRNKESILAKESGLLTLAGPFNLLQGGVGAAGRLPVFLPSNVAGKSEFWGFAIALIRFPEVLGVNGLDRLKAHGYQYRLWKPDPNTGKAQTIATSTQTDSL
jgi:sensor domain CHASE-containing protein